MKTSHDPADCGVCKVIVTNPGLSNTQLGYLAGKSERSVRRHKKARSKGAPLGSLPEPFFTDVPVEAITSRGRSIITPDGWEKITYSPQKVASLQAEKTLAADIMAALDGYVPAKPEPSGPRRAFAEVFGLSDEQVGKACESGGGTKDTVERVMASAESFKQRVLESQPQAIVITDLGDAIENMYNVPQHQLSTNDLDLTAQIRVARRLHLEVLKLLAPLAPQVYYVAVPSNHGQVRTGPKEAVGAVDNDFGIEISHQLEDICLNAESSELRKINFVRPDKYYETATLTLFGTKMAFNHGHRTKGGMNGHDSWWANQDHGRMPGWDADILFVAHYHTARVEQSGDGRWIVCVSASEPSSDYFALASGKRSKRGVTCVRVADRVWSHLEIV